MITALQYVTIIVENADKALAWYTETLGLELRMNRTRPDGYRVVTVGVPAQAKPEIILQEPHKAEHGEEQYARKLKQIGHNPTWVFHVDDCRKTLETLRAKGVVILEEATESPWGISALIRDLYGNLFTLTQTKVPT